MKNILNYFTIVVICLTVLSCEKFVSDMNVDPNNPTDAPVDLIFTGAQVNVRSLLSIC